MQQSIAIIIVGDLNYKYIKRYNPTIKIEDIIVHTIINKVEHEYLVKKHSEDNGRLMLSTEGKKLVSISPKIVLWRKVENKFIETREDYSKTRIVMNNKFYCFGGKDNELLNNLIPDHNQPGDKISTILCE